MDYIFKIIVLGNKNTGKTSFMRRYVRNSFSSHPTRHVGVDWTMKELNWDGYTIKLQLWDLGSQGEFGAMTKIYYRGTNGVVMMVNITEKTTFESIQNLKKDIDDKIKLANENDVPVILALNKCDLDKDPLFENAQMLNTFCEENNFIGWYETSAKDNIGITDCMNTLVRRIVNDDNKNPRPADTVK